MPRQVTKAAGNVYCQARLEAAKWNEKLLTRSGAAEVLGCVTEDSIKKYELGIVNPPNDAVAIMADAYNAPELEAWYCANECPLGKNAREIAQMPPERAVIRMANAARTLEETVDELARILDDGEVSEAEAEDFERLEGEFLEIRRRADEVLAMMKKIK